MLQPAGEVVHLVPRQAQPLEQEALPQPVAAHYFGRQLLPRLGQAHATVGLVGDEAVLIGRSGSEEITCQEVADRMGTITYEVTCLINRRVARTSDEV